jgi:hypothetical protein
LKSTSFCAITIPHTQSKFKFQSCAWAWYYKPFAPFQAILVLKVRNIKSKIIQKYKSIIWVQKYGNYKNANYQSSKLVKTLTYECTKQWDL